MSPTPLEKALAVTAAMLLAAFASASAALQGSGGPTPLAVPATQVRPTPAEIMPLASQAPVLDVVNTGKHLVAVGERGHILVSNDGTHWTQVPVPVRAALTSLTFVDAENGWAVGHDATIVATIDGGRTWFLQNFEPEKHRAFLGVAFTDAQHGYAVGAFGLFYSTQDGGANWAEVRAPAVRSEELYFHAIVKLNDRSLLIAGEAGMLGVSADGRNWKRLKSPYDGTFFGALPYGPKGAIVFGLRGNVYANPDVAAGRWKKIETGTTSSFYGGERLPDGRALLVGSAGAMLIVDPATGRTEAVESGVSYAFTSVADIKSGLLLASGEAGFKVVAH